ncbi:unnamed protein product [Adineta steineri]|uniref:Uncharacterized protein n=1 Tax=Adineta steineri TaxID=433720 RepID=A0A819CQN1_9BILA|nr:unnamed protein product [Adineta steineri]CAF3815973.1 unnamed protein product [Adineta steineri]
MDNLNVLTQSDSLYSIIDRTDSHRRALLKIYSTISDRSSRLRVERHRLALQRLAIEPLNNDDIDEEKESKQPERQSPTIDTGFICAILFWMITYHEPKAPH